MYLDKNNIYFGIFIKMLKYNDKNANRPPWGSNPRPQG
jgi:hypothetical protein